MNIIVKHSSPDAVVSDLLAIGLFEGQSVKEAGYGTLDAALGGLIEQVITAGDFEGKTLKARLLYTHGDAIATRRILLVGLGKQAEFTLAVARQAAGVAAQTLADLLAQHDGPVGRTGQPEPVQAFTAIDDRLASQEAVGVGLHRGRQ